MRGSDSASSSQRRTKTPIQQDGALNVVDLLLRSINGYKLQEEKKVLIFIIREKHKIDILPIFILHEKNIS